MSGPIFASPSTARLSGAPAAAAPVAAPQAWAKRQRDIGLAAFLAVSAAAGVLSAWVCLGSALSSLAPGASLGAAGSGHRQRAAPPAAASAPPASVIPSAPAAGSPLSTQVLQPRQPAPSVATGPVRAGGVAPGPGPDRSNIASEPPREASAERVSGYLGEVRDAATWVVGGQIVHLWGVRPDPAMPRHLLTDFAVRVAAAGPLGCRRQRYSRRYRCLTTAGQDLADLALGAGIGRAARGAPQAYRHAEAQSRTTAARR